MNELNEVDKKILSLCKENKKIEAIQLLMQTKKWTLAKSKEYVDNLIDLKLSEEESSTDIDERIITLCQKGEKIEAIKLVHQTLKLNLKESKKYVEILIHKYT